MPPRRKLSPRQIEILVDFAETHREIALGRFSGGPLSNQITKKAWEELAIKLNAIAEGCSKTPDQWRRYWIEFKAKTKTKAADSRRNSSRTGGGPNKLQPLTDVELRVLEIIGPVAVQGLAGVRLPTIDPTIHEEVPRESPTTPNTSSTIHQPDYPEYPELQMDIEWLESPPTLEATAPLLRRSPSIQIEVARAASPQPEQPRHSQAIPYQNNLRKRSQRKLRHDENVPRWAYDLELRRIEVEERIAASIEKLAEAVVKIQEAINENYNKK